MTNAGRASHRGARCTPGQLVQQAELALALAAAEVRPKREFMQQRGREHTEAKAARKMAGQAQHQAKQAFVAAAERLVAQQKREPERTKAQQAIGKLETHRGKAEQLAAAERTSEEAQTTLEDALVRQGQAEALKPAGGARRSRSGA